MSASSRKPSSTTTNTKASKHLSTQCRLHTSSSIPTTPKDFRLRFFYFAFACLLYSIWRAVDLLVQVELTGEYEHSPIVTADNTLTLLKKKTGIG
ncbi:transposase IS4 family protein [Haloarcula argentinensis DSM 12282]|nr:transposase IS4 family protein [Haloarcula argentinensis DSM 12282]